MTDIPAPKELTCNFCGHPHEVMKKGHVGGMKARICGSCIVLYFNEIAATAEAFQPAIKSPPPLAAHKGG